MAEQHTEAGSQANVAHGAAFPTPGAIVDRLRPPELEPSYGAEFIDGFNTCWKLIAAKVHIASREGFFNRSAMPATLPDVWARHVRVAKEAPTTGSVVLKSATVLAIHEILTQGLPPGESSKPQTPAPEPETLPQFPTALRKMWSGGEVQAWIDQHVAPLFARLVPDPKVRATEEASDAPRSLACVLPERDLSQPAQSQGLFRKFEVRRTDGRDEPGGTHYGSRYFVLDVDHDPHALSALTAYAAACEATHPALARDLRAKWGAQVAPGAVPEENTAEPAYAERDDTAACQGQAHECNGRRPVMLAEAPPQVRSQNASTPWTVDQLIEQAKQFASAWSLVTSNPCGNDVLYAEAKQERELLRQMIVHALAASRVEWFDCATILPEPGAWVLVAAPFDGDHDWRVKLGGRCPQTEAWQVSGGSWQPKKWAHLPRPVAGARTGA